MGYMANVPLRFGDGIIQPGERVPVERGRNYPLMLRLNQISVVPETRAARQPESEDGERLEDLTRAELDRRAGEAGVEDPERLPNKDAVIEALHGAE